MKKPGSVSTSSIKNTSGMLSKIGLFVVNSETCRVKIYDAKNIIEIPTICPKTGNAIYLKNFSKLRKYSFVPLKNIFTIFTNVESFFATVFFLFHLISVYINM